LAIKDPSALLVLGIYLRDVGKKLQSLEETAERLRIFIETLNAMLLFKKLRISPDIGFQVIGGDGKTIALRALSSGEQHLIVLLGEVIFESVESGVVLLDEPEISFHPEWQELFPEVLEKVVKLNGCMIVMATHSPTLIQDRWDSVVELADQVAK
jgi:predicted ATP-binding protein involved in virulence